MDVPPNTPDPSMSADQTVTATPSSTKILGIERRLIGFGFALLAIFFLLALIYSLFTTTRFNSSVETVVPPRGKTAADTPPTTTNTSLATPDTVVDDLIDEATADREVVDEYAADEMADIEDGSNN